MKKAKDFKGVSQSEVWDHRLSTADFTIYREGTWKVRIEAKNPDDPAWDEHPGLKITVVEKGDEFHPEKVARLVVLEEHDTGIAVEKGDTYDTEKVAQCYEWLHSVRDKYARPDIEELKPALAVIRANYEVLHGLKYELANESEGSAKYFELVGRCKQQLDDNNVAATKALAEAETAYQQRLNGEA